MELGLVGVSEGLVSEIGLRLGLVKGYIVCI